MRGLAMVNFKFSNVIYFCLIFLKVDKVCVCVREIRLETHKMAKEILPEF